MEAFHLAVFFILHFMKSDLAVADSYQKNPSGKPSLRDNQGHSRNEIPLDEIKPKSDELHHYYLPTMQTTFGSYLDPTVYGASITSPPNIAPASVYKSYNIISSSTVEQDPIMNSDAITSYVSQCISETPSKEKLESDVILSSRMFIPENHVLSGHTEIFSKTSSESDISNSKMVSESSVPFERTHIYMPSATDL